MMSSGTCPCGELFRFKWGNCRFSPSASREWGLRIIASTPEPRMKPSN
jgi:hypothetical protein